jgi:uncharacterized membrane protein
MTYEREERDVIIDRGDGTGVGTVVGIILAIIVVLAIVWFLFLGGFNPGTNPDAPQQQQNIEIQPVQPPAP